MISESNSKQSTSNDPQSNGVLNAELLNCSHTLNRVGCCKLYQGLECAKWPSLNVSVVIVIH